MNDIMQRVDLSWPEKLGVVAYLTRKMGRGEADMPVTHRFTPGMYIREMFIPKGTYFIGRAHRRGHRMTLDSGRIRMIMENFEKELQAPASMDTVPYFQTVLEALTDVWGSTYHPNPTNSRDIDALEADIFHPAEDVFRIGEAVCARLCIGLSSGHKEIAA